MSDITEFCKVLRIIQKKFPKCVNYDVIGVSEKSYAVLLDKNDKKLATISEKQLTAYWNKAEQD